MSRTEDIDNAIWDEADFFALSAPAKLVYIWSWTNRRCDFSGIYQVPLSAIVFETKHDDQTVRDSLVELEQAEFVFYDGTWLWCKARVKRIKTRTVQMCKAIAKDLARVPNSHPFREKLLDLHGARVWQSKDIRTTIGGELQCLTDGNRETSGSDPTNGSSEPSGGSYTREATEAPMTGTGKGTGTPLGRGAGRGYQPSTEWTAVRDLHFPGREVGTIESAAFVLQQKRREPTIDAIREILGDEVVAA